MTSHPSNADGLLHPDPTPPPEGAAAWILGTGGAGNDLVTTKLGIEILDWNPDRLVGTMPVAGNRQTYGFLHGGASAVLAETLGSLGALLYAGNRGIVLGQELSCTHHRSVRSGTVTGVCVPLHLGDSTACYEIVLNDDADRRICTARLSCQIRRAHPGAGPMNAATPRSVLITEGNRSRDEARKGL